MNDECSQKFLYPYFFQKLETRFPIKRERNFPQKSIFFSSYQKILHLLLLLTNHMEGSNLHTTSKVWCAFDKIHLWPFFKHYQTLFYRILTYLLKIEPKCFMIRKRIFYFSFNWSLVIWSDYRNGEIFCPPSVRQWEGHKVLQSIMCNVLEHSSWLFIFLRYYLLNSMGSFLIKIVCYWGR